MSKGFTTFLITGIISIALSLGGFYLMQQNDTFGLSIYRPFQGGTGTSDTPSEGDLLVGTSSGVYTATTTLPGAYTISGSLSAPVSLAVSSDLDMGGNDITNAGAITGTYFVATSTTATSTFAGGFAVETSGLVYDYSTNLVGIGTTSPSTLLQIGAQHGGDSDLWMSFDNYSAGGFGDWAFGKVGNNDLTIFNGTNGIDFSNARVTFDFDGNVGIGNTSPSASLHIGDTSSGVVEALYFSNTSTIARFGIAGGGSDIISSTSAGDLALVNTASKDIIFGTGGTAVGNERMRITSAGNVGIGDTTPTAKLAVLGTTEQLRLNYDATNYASFTTSLGGDLTIAPTGGDTTITGNLLASGQITTHASANANAEIGLYTGGFDVDEGLVLQHDTYASTRYIGTGYALGANPVKAFSGFEAGDVAGNGLGDLIWFLDATNDTNKVSTADEAMRLTSRLLKVRGSVSGSWQFDGATEGGIAIGSGLADGRFYAQGSQSAGVVLYDSGGTADERTINFQINGGTSKIQSQNDSGTLNNLFIEMNHSTDALSLNSGGGNVGIATSSPAYKLDLYGDFRIDNGEIKLTPKALTDGATITIDWSTGNVFYVTLTDNRALAFSNVQVGQEITVYVTQDGTGSRTLSMPAETGGPTITLSTTAGVTDILWFGSATSTATVHRRISAGQ